MDFDYAPPLAVAGGLVYRGSSTDHTLRAFDAVTGEERWRYVAGGPIRFGVRLHFAELDAAATGEQVFDIRVQGEVCRAAFDPVAAAGMGVAVVVDAPAVTAAAALVIEFTTPDGKPASSASLAALEVFEVGYEPAATPATQSANLNP
jgi:outer membrane protein assembly factor BamB